MRRELLARLSLVGVDGLAPLRLYRATPTSRLSQLGGDTAPYFAHAWGGGLALAHHMKMHPQVVAGRRVLDLGTGGGIAALSASIAGAAGVTGVDIDPLAVATAKLNAEANGLSVHFETGDALTVPVAAEVVLAGDLFYDADLAVHMLTRLREIAADGVDVLIGDPGRRTLPLDALQPVACYPVQDFGESSGEAASTGTIYTIRH